MGRNLADDEDEAMAALLGARRRAVLSAGTTALRPGTPPDDRQRAPAASRAAIWAPWAALAAACAIGGGCIAGGVAVAGSIAAALWPQDEAAGWALESLYTAIIFLPMLLLALAGARASGITALAAGPRVGAMLALGAALGAGGVGVATGYAAFAGVAQGGAGGAPGALILLGTLAMLLQSGTEELLLRGWLQPALAARWHPWAAVLATALVFAGLHLLGGVRGPIEFGNLMLGGILFGLLRWKSGGIAAPIAAHFAWNWSEALLLGLAPNPGIGGFGAVFDIDLVGAPSWGGSAEGLNGSLAMAVVLLALIAPLALWRGSTRA